MPAGEGARDERRQSLGGVPLIQDDRPSYFPHAPRFFLAQLCLGLSPEQSGALRTLVDVSWLETQPCSIPDDDASLARLAGFRDDVASWQKCRSVVLSGWTRCADGRWTLPWLREMYDYAVCKSRKARESANAKRPRNGRTANAQPPLDTGASKSCPSGSVPRETSLLIWNQYSALYLAYPRARRGSKGDFGRFLLPAWNAVEARGDSEPCPHLLPIVTAYAGSWLVKSNSGVVGPERFFDHDGVWTQDPKDWEAPDVSINGKPGGSISRADSGEARANKRDREYPEEIVVPIIRVGGHRAGGHAAQTP